MKRTGIFLCLCNFEVAESIDFERVTAQVKELQGVVHVEQYSNLCLDPQLKSLREVVKELNLDAVVLTSCAPAVHEKAFQKAAEAAGIKPEHFRIVEILNPRINGNGADPTQALITAIETAVSDINRGLPVSEERTPIVKKALVIGGGVAGIHVALDIAEAGYEVYLVEKSSSIGGHMVQISEVFPTLDCPQCILTPKMVQCNQHPNIHIMAYSEVEEVSGHVGNFQVTIKHKTPYIDWDKCTGCGECGQVCTVSYPSEYDRWVVDQKAIFKPFAQAVPNKFVIEKKGISPCKNICPINCNAQGYVALIASGHFKEAIQVIRETIPFPGVLGRVCNHLCQTKCLRGDLDEPVSIKFLKRFAADWERQQGLRDTTPPETIHKEKVAIVGSGPAGLTAAYFLAKAGYLSTIFEALPVAGGMLAACIPEYRLPRDILEYEIQLVKDLGVEIRLNTPIGKELTIDDLFRQGYQAVFLAPGAHKSLKLGIEGEDSEGVIDCIKFLYDVNLGKEVKLGDRVGVIGGGNAAIDAARVAKRLGCKKVSIIYRRTRAEMPANKEEVDAADQEGIDIQILTSPKRVLTKDGKMVGLECIRNKLGPPDASGRRRPVPIEGSEFVIELDNLIPAISQEPDLSFLGKEHDFKISKWNTFEVDPETLATNKPGVFAGGDAVTGPKTVVEAMQAGRVAAEMIIKYIRGEELKREPTSRKPLEVVEKVTFTEEHRKYRPVAMPEIDPASRIVGFEEVELGFTEEMAVAEAKRCLSCGGCSECRYCETACEAHAIDHSIPDRYETLNVGAIVVATGYELLSKEQMKEFEPDPDILDPLQFERLLAPGGPTAGAIYRPSDGRVPKEVVFISCTGSRDPERHLPYCSRVCCMYSCKMGMLYKHAVPDGQVYNFYMDVRCDGKMYEEFYQRGVEEDGIVYLRGQVSKIFRQGDKLIVWGSDTLSGQKVEVAADLVVLALAMVPRQTTAELVKKLGVSTNEWGFINEIHPKLKPVETSVPGIFMAGTCQAPKDIPEVVAHASGCAGKVLELFSQDEVVWRGKK
ncbi:MAG: FAD-dependent oxidoreductase [candidate division KSB1 bacterium]|nr:FAD-dependent oxidoreductase [candidate division KSB1 bacterium]